MFQRWSAHALIPMPATASATGGNGAHPTYECPCRHETHAGAHTRPGTQYQPESSSRNQRP